MAVLPPDPHNGGAAYLAHLEKVRGHRRGPFLVDGSDAAAEYNVRHALLVRDEGLSFSEATNVMASRHPKLAERLGLSVSDERRAARAEQKVAQVKADRVVALRASFNAQVRNLTSSQGQQFDLFDAVARILHSNAAIAAQMGFVAIKGAK